MRDTQMFSSLPPHKLALTCALPNMLGMAVMALYTVVDGIFVGQFLGESALAAVNLVMPYIMIACAFSDMIAVGSSVQIAIKLGQQNEKQARRIFSLCTALIVAVSCLVSAALFFASKPLIALMGADSTMTAMTTMARDYMGVFAIFAPFILISFALDNYLRICGKLRYSLAVMVGTSVLNIFLDWLFLAKMGLGIGSAALATCLSMTLSTLLLLLPFLFGKLALRFVKPLISLRLLGNILANGSSEFFANMAGSLQMAIINAVLLHLSGTTAVAAFSIIMYIDCIAKPMLFGLADALQPAISYNYGAGNMSRVFSIEKIVLLASAIFSILVMFIMLTSGEWIVRLFLRQSSSQLLAMTISGMQLFAFSYLFSWMGVAASSFFTALNRPLTSLLMACTQALIFPLASLAVLVPILQLDGVWLAPTFSAALSLLLAICLLNTAVKSLRRQDSKREISY